MTQQCGLRFRHYLVGFGITGGLEVRVAPPKFSSLRGILRQDNPTDLDRTIAKVRSIGEMLCRF